MTSLRRQVESTLDTVSPQSGIVVVDSDLRLLAEREPAPGGCAVVIVVDGEAGTGEER